MSSAASMGPTQLVLVAYIICALISLTVAGIISLLFTSIKMRRKILFSIIKMRHRRAAAAESHGN